MISLLGKVLKLAEAIGGCGFLAVAVLLETGEPQFHHAVLGLLLIIVSRLPTPKD